MSSLRFNAVEEAFKKKAIEVTAPSKFTSDYYGKFVFNSAAMAKYLSKDTLKALKNVITKGATLDIAMANQIASGKKLVKACLQRDVWSMHLGMTTSLKYILK